jgi:hypothetical protein
MPAHIAHSNATRARVHYRSFRYSKVSKGCDRSGLVRRHHHNATARRRRDRGLLPNERGGQGDSGSCRHKMSDDGEMTHAGTNWYSYNTIE